ncbi:unnamed protein product [Hermetia illucens]|uniref:Alpha-carbonic anhydrase domain-containing protein n=2 Tax=Hermetia illucens TaxID=343691 RepID=A0A7R8YZK7_HERIL|nr:unnamed protein product [Hermetia illucens]
MNGIYSVLTSYIYVQPYILFLLSVFCAGLLLANFHYAKQLCELLLCTGKSRLNFDFDYGARRGPHKWKEFFPAARGCYQSPINIRTETTEILKISEPLIWRNYDDLPAKVAIENTGHTVDLKAHYVCNQPILSGADLLESYSFVSLCFRWSALDNEGSEHSINDRKYPLEMQATHISKENTEFNPSYIGDLGILVLSYFFTITKFDNPYLDPIILNLHHIREPFKRVEIPPFPISWLCYPFKSGFYSYGGSLTEPPCSEGVTWFVQPEPMSISETQLAEFRLLLSKDHASRILRNSRPVQNLNSRIVCYNRFDQFSRLSETAAEGDEQQAQAICS